MNKKEKSEIFPMNKFNQSYLQASVKMETADYKAHKRSNISVSPHDISQQNGISIVVDQAEAELERKNLEDLRLNNRISHIRDEKSQSKKVNKLSIIKKRINSSNYNSPIEMFKNSGPRKNFRLDLNNNMFSNSTNAKNNTNKKECSDLEIPLDSVEVLDFQNTKIEQYKKLGYRRGNKSINSSIEKRNYRNSSAENTNSHIYYMNEKSKNDQQNILQPPSQNTEKKLNTIAAFMEDSNKKADTNTIPVYRKASKILPKNLKLIRKDIPSQPGLSYNYNSVKQFDTLQSHLTGEVLRKKNQESNFSFGPKFEISRPSTTLNNKESNSLTINHQNFTENLDVIYENTKTSLRKNSNKKEISRENTEVKFIEKKGFKERIDMKKVQSHLIFGSLAENPISNETNQITHNTEDLFKNFKSRKIIEDKKNHFPEPEFFITKEKKNESKGTESMVTTNYKKEKCGVGIKMSNIIGLDKEKIKAEEKTPEKKPTSLRSKIAVDFEVIDSTNQNRDFQSLFVKDSINKVTHNQASNYKQKTYKDSNKKKSFNFNDKVEKKYTKESNEDLDPTYHLTTPSNNFGDCFNLFQNSNNYFNKFNLNSITLLQGTSKDEIIKHNTNKKEKVSLSKTRKVNKNNVNPLDEDINDWEPTKSNNKDIGSNRILKQTLKKTQYSSHHVSRETSMNPLRTEVRDIKEKIGDVKNIFRNDSLTSDDIEFHEIKKNPAKKQLRDLSKERLHNKDKADQPSVSIKKTPFSKSRFYLEAERNTSLENIIRAKNQLIGNTDKEREVFTMSTYQENTQTEEKNTHTEINQSKHVNKDSLDFLVSNTLLSNIKNRAALNSEYTNPTLVKLGNLKKKI